MQRPDEPDPASSSPGLLPQIPIEVGVLAHPHILAIAPDLLEGRPSAELGGPLDHRGQRSQQPPRSQMQPDEEALCIVLGVHTAADAARIAHGGVNGLEERARNENVRIDEDQHVARGLARSGVARLANALYRLVNHGRAQVSRATAAVPSVLLLSTTMTSTPTSDRARR